MNLERNLWAPVALVVSLLMIGMLPVVEAPSDQTWDVAYSVDGVYPELASPVWNRLNVGNINRAIVYHDQILNVSFTTAVAGTDLYYQYVEDAVGEGASQSTMVVIEWRLRMPTSMGASGYVSVMVTPWGGGNFEYQITDNTIRLLSSSTPLLTRYEDDIIGSNHTYRFIYYKGTDGNTHLDGYYDERFIGSASYSGFSPTPEVWWRMAYGGDITSAHYEWDYVIYRTTNLEQRLEDELAERDARIDELEKELNRLKKDLEGVKPGVRINQTNLPCIPHDTRGTLEYDTLFVDPYLVTVYDLLTFKSGSDLDFYLIYPSSSDEVTVMSDWIHIEETSYTRLWINDTAGSGTELLNTTDAVGPFNLEYGYNITVQTSGASSSVRADRTSTVRLISSFEWGESTQTGIFATTSKIENDLGFDAMENVVVRWAFPVEDSESRTVNIDMTSVTVFDADNNLVLDRGRHYSLDESSVILELRWLNTSDSRTFRIEFTRESFVETVEYFTVYDNDITISDTYGNAPFTSNVHFTASGGAFFQGQIIIRFDLSGRYAGERLDIHTLIIKRSDSSGSQEYTYDSISNELRITDVTVDAGDSVTYSLFWNWLEPQGVVVAAILGQPLVMYSALLFIGAVAFFSLTGATKDEKAKKYLGIASIVFVLVAVIVIFAVGG